MQIEGFAGGGIAVQQGNETVIRHFVEGIRSPGDDHIASSRANPCPGEPDGIAAGRARVDDRHMRSGEIEMPCEPLGRVDDHGNARPATNSCNRSRSILSGGRGCSRRCRHWCRSRRRPVFSAAPPGSNPHPSALHSLPPRPGARLGPWTDFGNRKPAETESGTSKTGCCAPGRERGGAGVGAWVKRASMQSGRFFPAAQIQPMPLTETGRWRFMPPAFFQ